MALTKPETRDAAAPAHNGAGGHNGTAKSGIWVLTLGSLGVVYGDIGTSPLYAFREALHAAIGGPNGPVTPDAVRCYKPRPPPMVRRNIPPAFSFSP